MLLSPREDEGVSWMRVLENIVNVVDPLKLESATGSEWRAAIGRCLALLPGDTAGAQVVSLLVANQSNDCFFASVTISLCNASAEVTRRHEA